MFFRYNCDLYLFMIITYNIKPRCICCRGLRSEKTDKYQWPADVKHREAVICPVDTPFTLPPPGTKATLSAPHMYRTEYQNVGSKKPITV